MRRPLIIEGARAIDPGVGLDAEVALVIADGKIEAIDPVPVPKEKDRYDGRGLWLLPGLIDLHVHFRDPGFIYKEDLLSGSRAAAAGGFTTVVCMPNTMPPIDTVVRLNELRERIERVQCAKILPAACLTKGSEGRELVDFQGLARAGAVAFTDDGRCPQDEDVMERCMRAVGSWGLIMEHAEDLDLSQKGSIHAGPVAETLGTKGIPRESEIRIVGRDLSLVRKTGARLHIQHLSCRESVELIRQAKGEGLPVTCEACPHHLVLTVNACLGGDPVFKVNPPLREERDREALLQGLCDGTIDAIATDHAPHSAEEKSGSLEEASFGMVGLESAFPVLLTELVESGIVGPSRLIELLFRGPAEILGLEGRGLVPGSPADLTLIDPQASSVLDPVAWQSKGRNCPFAGRQVRGKVIATIRGGDVVYGLPLRSS